MDNMGGLVQASMNPSDLLVLFSGSGSRPETLQVVNQAISLNIEYVLITKTDVSPIREKAAVVIDLPPISSRLFGAGDFELVSSYLPEALVAAIGKKRGISPISVDRWDT